MLEHMFFVPLVHLKVQNWNYKKKQLLDLYSSILSDCKIHDTVYTNYHQDNYKIIDNVQSIFQEELRECTSILSIDRSIITSAWFEKTNQNAYHKIHNHGALGYSSVCFINFNHDKHTPTKFISPFNNFLTGTTLQYTPNNISEGSIIFFPSSINHFTDPNQSDEERLIVSFNFN